MNSEILHKDGDRPLDGSFSTGVSLHGHTLHSRESVKFIKRLTRESRIVRWVIHHHFKTRSDSPSVEQELARIWWTSPVSASQALHLERRQIETQLEMAPIVSLTDHDNLDAPLHLQLAARNEHVPVSVEWSTLFGDTYFHIGVHNLPPKSAAEIFGRMKQCKTDVRIELLDGLMDELAEMPGVLIVFNHPMWDQPGRGAKAHAQSVSEFIKRYRGRIHALEINGMRTCKENQKVVKLAEEVDLPLISGGDRHGLEPNATLNVTNASTFAEFADEIIRDGHSRVVIMPQYREPHFLRVIQTIGEILGEHPDHALGFTQWSERVFRIQADGTVCNFSQLFDHRGEPPMLRHLVRIMKIVTSQRLRPAFRLAFAKSPQEVL